MLLHRLFRKRLGKFSADRRGNVAPIFALAMVPVIGFVGAAVDYSRAGSARTSLQSALDATALFLSREAQGLTPEQVSEKGREYFDSIFHNSDAKSVALNTQFESSGGNLTVKVSATAHVDTIIARVLGQDQVPIRASTDVVWGMKRLELALVLDNTTSMASQDRMVELKKATKSLLETLKKAALKPDDVKVAIIPYGTDVNVNPSNVSASWLDWGDSTPSTYGWESPPAIMASWIKGNQLAWDLTGPSSSCPFSNNSHGFRCNDGLATNANESNLDTIRSSGSKSGLICPGRDNGSKGTAITGVLTDRYYNGCYNSVEKPSADWHVVATGSDASCGSRPNCSCSGGGRNKTCVQKTFNHVWRPNGVAEATPARSSTWTGCVRDRKMDYDASDAAPASAETKFQPIQARNCGGSAALASVLPLTNDWTALETKVDAMNTGGGTSGTRYTNITIGLAWGWHALFNNDPMSQASEPKDDLDKVIILMTDGDNTRSGWSTSPSDIDARTELACNNFKALEGTVPGGIKLYTIRVMDGNEALLRKCASKTDMYYNVQQASQLNAVFSTIAKNLASLRIAK